MFLKLDTSCCTLLSFNYLCTRHIHLAAQALILSSSFHTVVYAIYTSLKVTGGTRGLCSKSIDSHQYNKATIMISLFFFARHTAAEWPELNGYCQAQRLRPKQN